MPASGNETTYRLKLVEGDVIEATITNLSRGGAEIDTSLWSNVDTARLREVGQNTSIAPGSDVYATVTGIDSGTATLKRKRGVYRRNHLPGDRLRVQGSDRISSSLVRATPEELRNLEVIFVAGIAVGADATVELTKVRDGTAIALPVDVHEPGLAPGRTIIVETTAGQRDARVKRFQTDDGDARTPDQDFIITLTKPAPATGQATATLTSVTDEGIRGELQRDWNELPSAGTTVRTSVSAGHDQASVQLDNSDVEIRIKFEQPCPIDGQAIVELGERQDGVYPATLDRYTRPRIQTGGTYSARVYKSKDRARIEIGERKVSVILLHNVSTTGQATVRVTELSDAIYGQIEGGVEPLTFDDSDSDSDALDVDMTDVSKF